MLCLLMKLITMICWVFFQSEFEEQYDIVQKIGEGWYSRVYLTEHRSTHHELVLKAVNNKNMSVEEFLREFHHSLILGAHQNILTVFPDMVFSLEGQCCMFASEYAPLGKHFNTPYMIYVTRNCLDIKKIWTFLFLVCIFFS